MPTEENTTTNSGGDALTDNLKGVTESLYKQNAELAIKNKALLLLGELYAISIQTLAPKDLGQKISEAICKALEFELVALFLYEEEKDLVLESGFSASPRFLEELTKREKTLEGVQIGNVQTHPFFEDIIVAHKAEMHGKFGYILGNAFSEDIIEGLIETAHIKASLVYPVVVGPKVLGFLVFSLNREYDGLSAYEKEIIGNLVNVVSVALDKSLVYEALGVANEKLKSLDKLKTEFLSLASHQLRSPLTAIKGYTSMLLEGSFGVVAESQREAIDRVYQSSNHLAKVVEDLLNVTKIEQGGMKYEMASFDMEKPAHDLATDLSITAKKKGLELTFVTDTAGPYMVNGDMEKLRQVMLNLIDNSIKYTESGWVKVGVFHDTINKKIRFSVSDSGMGVTPEIKATLFQKFSRGDGGKVNAGGSGLGLYLGKEIVEAHKGRIWIDSEGKGKGSTFSFELDAI